ncbi:MAG TPA: helix-hairpin-helix domain-containing protein, partial [Nitrospirota bacterium]|nr:helix-hairpin-helix domain-containing protein [Nitrospirota bacterium]
MHDKKEHVLSWIGLSSIPGVGRATFRKLVRHFGSAERSLAASPGELREVEGLSSKAADAVGAFDWRGPAEREVAKAEEAGVAIVTLDDPSYP